MFKSQGPGVDAEEEVFFLDRVGSGGWKNTFPIK